MPNYTYTCEEVDCFTQFQHSKPTIRIGEYLKIVFERRTTHDDGMNLTLEWQPSYYLKYCMLLFYGDVLVVHLLHKFSSLKACHQRYR